MDVLVGRDKRVSRLFWRVETPRHRWSVRVHFWLAPGNWWRWNPQPAFTDFRVARCLVFDHSRIGRQPRSPSPHTSG